MAGKPAGPPIVPNKPPAARARSEAVAWLIFLPLWDRMVWDRMVREELDLLE